MEMMESIKIVRWCLDNIEPGPVIADIPRSCACRRQGEAYVGIENPRGELGHYVVSDGGKVVHPHPRAGPVVRQPRRARGRSWPGNLIADAVAIIGSTDIVVGETDR